MSKKIIKLIILLFVTSLTMIGCNRITTVEENTTENTTPIETTTVEMFQECTVEEYEKAHEDIEIIMQAFLNQNKNSLKEILTNTVKENEPKLDTKIQLAFDMIDGEVTSYKEVDAQCIESLVYWEERCTLYFTYEVQTSDITYFLDVCYLPRTDTKHDNTGVYFVNLRDYENDTIYHALGTPFDVTMGGVFSSDQYTMDYNAEQIALLYEEIGYDQSVTLLAAVELNRVSTEKIETIELVEVDDYGCSEYIVMDCIGDVYHILANENGFIDYIDKNGKTILNPDYI